MSDAGRQPAAILGGVQLLGAAAIGAVTCLVLLKGHGPAVRAARTAIAYCRNPLRHQRVQICNTPEECEAAVRALKIYCAEYRVIGFDCEWVTVNASRRPVALLQLAAHNGYCALIRLHRLQQHGGGVPAGLRELLDNGRIVKVGVAPMDDARNLQRDYGLRVTSTLDLRHMARARRLPALGLAKMSLAHLGVTMDKDWRISCSNWEAPELSARQIDYAAKDALVAVELFRRFAGHRGWGWRLGLRRGSELRETLSECDQWLDVGFSVAAAAGVMRKNQQQLANGRSSSTPTPLTRRSMSTRATPLYENCYLQAPDGQLLCTCDRKKAEWYVQKGIGTAVAEAPLTVRLRFEPAGRAVGEVGRFYQQEKENRCVVCGCAESYQRKNIVPREYRKCFPPIMKDHTSHDVLLLCPVCHQRSNVADLAMRHRLATLADAPFTGSNGGAVVAPTVENRDLKKLKSAAKALRFNAGQIPANRVDQLQAEVLSHYPAGTELSADLLGEASEINTHEPNDDYCAHGEKVVVHFQQHSETGGLIELERMWRTHFLEVMRPQHLPDLWSVEHSVDKLGIRVAENRITADELVLSGMKLTETTEAIL